MCAKIPENTSLVDKEKFDAIFQRSYIITDSFIDIAQLLKKTVLCIVHSF